MKNVIILVDDNEDIRELFADLFENTEIDIISFVGVTEAKEYLMNPENVIRVKAIVSDLMMGPMDGLEFLHYVKAQPELRDIDFYLQTGTATKEIEPFLKSSLLKGIIEKPFNLKLLASLFI